MRPEDYRALAGGGATLLGLSALAPLLTDGAWVLPSVVAVCVVVATGILLRRMGLSAPSVVLGQVVVLALLCGNLVAWDATGPGPLPGPDWLAQVTAHARDGLAIIATEPAPVDVSDGILALTALGAGVAALLVDVLAVAMNIPAAVGVVLVAIVAIPTAVTGQEPAWQVVVMVGAGYLLLLATSTGRGSPQARLDDAAENRAAGRTNRPRIVLLLGATSLAAAVIAPTLLPQLGGDGSGSGPGGSARRGGITTENPIVDLRRDLVRGQNVDVLHYRTDAEFPDYLRLVSLDQFDGTTWHTSRRSVPESQQLPAGMPNPPGLVPELTPSTVNSYQIVVSDVLQSRWLPLPYPAVDVEAAGDWRFDIGSLDVVSASGTTAGLQYQVQSLQVSPTSPPEDADVTVDDPMLAVPAGVAGQLTTVAAEVTDGIEGSFEKAIAMQDWFRNDGGFVYDTANTPAGSASDDLLAFLQDRRGYCEQYAATMALMARVEGIPARVAVGYRPGDRADVTAPGTPDIPGEGELRVVRAHDAHAWPELYFAGVGWLRFEPTPTQVSGAPPGYTVPAAGPDPGAEQEANPALEQEVNPGPLEEGVPTDVTPDATASPASQAWLVAVLILVVALVVLLPPLLHRALRRRRWRQARGNASRLADEAWQEAVQAAAVTGVAWPESSTPREVGRWLVLALELDSEDDLARVNALVSGVETAWYTRDPAADESLESTADEVRHLLLGHAPAWRQALNWWMPFLARRSVPVSAESASGSQVRDDSTPGSRDSAGRSAPAHVVPATTPAVFDPSHE